MTNFTIVTEDAFSSFIKKQSITPVHNKRLLSLVNDFENGAWRHDSFDKFIWNNVKETALSFRDRQAFIGEGEGTVLTEAARNLRLTDSVDDIGKGSEIAEIFLYGVMKNYYKALPVVPKIFYKQNKNDNAKGADSVHIVIEGDNFSLWLGESKFYKSIENARLKEIIDSVVGSLSLDKLKKENSIITSVSDIDEMTEIAPELKTKIKAVLSRTASIDLVKPILHIPILLLHECEITRKETHLTKEYLDSIRSYHQERAEAYFERQIEACKDVDLYSDINFHVIIFPVPEKKKIVEKFVFKAKALKQ